MTWSRCRQSGVTLVELVVSIVVLSVASTAVMMLITQTSLTSADPMLRQQAVAIAEAYLEEVLALPMSDPDGGEVNGPEAGETRASYDDVWDYNGLSDSAGAVDQSGAAIAGLAGYNVSISVSSVTRGGAPALRIALQVTHDGQPGMQLPMVAYRFN